MSSGLAALLSASEVCLLRWTQYGLPKADNEIQIFEVLHPDLVHLSLVATINTSQNETVKKYHLCSATFTSLRDKREAQSISVLLQETSTTAPPSTADMTKNLRPTPSNPFQTLPVHRKCHLAWDRGTKGDYRNRLVKCPICFNRAARRGSGSYGITCARCDIPSGTALHSNPNCASERIQEEEGFRQVEQNRNWLKDCCELVSRPQ